MLITEAKKHFILCVQWQNSMRYHANDKTLTSIAPSVEFVSTPPLWCWRYFHPWPIAFRQTGSFIILHHSCLALLPLTSTTPFIESAPYVACFFSFLVAGDLTVEVEEPWRTWRKKCAERKRERDVQWRKKEFFLSLEISIECIK